MRANSRPNPLPAPVMTATLPARSFMIVSWTEDAIESPGARIHRAAQGVDSGERSKDVAAHAAASAATFGALLRAFQRRRSADGGGARPPTARPTRRAP